MIPPRDFDTFESWLADSLISAAINPMDPTISRTVLVVWQMVEELHEEMILDGTVSESEASDRIGDLAAVATGALALLDHALRAGIEG
jgi:hypothetical protein